MVTITIMIGSLSLKALRDLVSRWLLKGNERADDSSVCPVHRDLFNPQATCQKPHLRSTLAHASIGSPEELPRGLPISKPLLGCECIYYVLTICTYFHCLTHCICLRDAPGFIMSEFYLAKVPDPGVLSMYRTACLKCSGPRLWRRVGIRSVQIL